MKATDVVDYSLLTVGSVWSLTNIEQILGIIILIIQLIWLLTKIVIKIAKSLKANKSINIENDFDAVVDIISDVEDIIVNEGDENNESDDK